MQTFRSERSHSLTMSKIWGIFFLYSFFVSAFVQFILLPYIFPMWHAGHGLLNSAFDTICFHNLAVDLANKISIQGWSAWQLRYGGQTPAGIASIFYYFILPDPRILIPLNAALHASAALVLVNLLNLFLNNKTKAILCVLPFLIFPSNLTWVAQWHRDIFSILGVVLLLQGIVSLSILENYKAENWVSNNLYSIIFCTCGFILIWIGRPYILAIIMPLVELFFLLLFSVFLIRAFKKKISWQKTLLVSLSTLLIIFTLTQMKTYLYYPDFKESTSSSLDDEEEVVKREVGEVPKPAIITQPVINKPSVIEARWKRSWWLPPFIEHKAYYLALTRAGFRFTAPEAKSNIDHDIGFGSAKDILIYLPRAVQIAFLAPFPNQWLCEGSYPANSLMRRVSAFEMIVVYFALIFLPYAIWHWRKRIEIWIISLFCFYMMIVHGLVVCNVGTLYRMRYVYITILVALGIAGFIIFFGQVKNMIKRRFK